MALDKQKILQKLIKDFDPIIADYLEKRKPADSEEKDMENCEMEDSEEESDSEDENGIEIEISNAKKMKK